MKIELSGHYTVGRILRTIFPSVGMMVIMNAYSIVDGYFVSNWAGSTAFAAMNLIWPAIAVLASLGFMLGTGGSALVSKTLGEGDRERASRIFTMVVFVSIISGTAAGVLLYVFMEPLVRALGASSDMVPLAMEYGRTVALALPAFVLQLVFQSFYMTAERPQLGTWMSFICGVANIGLDALLIAGFGMGLKGAATSTAISLAAGGIFPIVWFSSKRNDTHLQFVRTGIDWRAIGKSCTNGISEYIGNIAFNLICVCYNIQLMNHIGENGVSAYGIIMYISFIFAALFIGYNLSMSQVVAYNFGAGNKDELHSLLVKSITILGSFGIILTVMAEAFALPITRIFVGYDKDIVELTVHATRIYMLSFIICGINMFTSAWFTALNNGGVSAVAAFTRTLVFELSAVFILPAIFGVDGIWMSVNVAEVLALILSALLIVSCRKRYGY